MQRIIIGTIFNSAPRLSFKINFGILVKSITSWNKKRRINEIGRFFIKNHMCDVSQPLP